MDWLKIIIETTQEKSEDVSGLLIGMGCEGTESIDPEEIRKYFSHIKADEYVDEALIPADRGCVKVIGYLDGDSDKEKIIGLLSGYNAAITKVSDNEWANSWKKYYNELFIGKKILICPSWKGIKRSAGRKVIYIDPGIVFGTGEHETTYMCAEALAEMIGKDDHVLDIGTGSGILAIIAAKLGASRVRAIDISVIAVRVAKENAASNRVGSKVEVLRSETGSLDAEKYDIITANITAGVLSDIRNEIRKRLKAEGLAILSGIIRDRSEELIGKYIETGFTLVKEYRIKEWVAVVFHA